MEYRHRANAHLPHHRPTTPDPGPLPEIVEMLVADKIQNRKDFEVSLRGHIPNTLRLDAYFQEWFAALGISEDVYAEQVRELAERSCADPRDALARPCPRREVERMMKRFSSESLLDITQHLREGLAVGPVYFEALNPDVSRTHYSGETLFIDEQAVVYRSLHDWCELAEALQARLQTPPPSRIPGCDCACIL